MPLPQKTAADFLIESRNVVFAREDPGEPFSYRAVEVLKGDPEIRGIDLFVNSTTRRLLGANKSHVAVLCRVDEDSPWRSLGVADEGYQHVVRGILTSASQWGGKGGAERRGEFFLPLFGHQNRLLFELAYLELGRAPYATIKRVARSASREALLPLLQQPQYLQWRPLAILMLAHCGKPSDKQYISEEFRSAERLGLTTNLAAWAAAAIEIEGPTAVAFIEHSYFDRPGRAQEELLEIIKALSLHGTEGRTELRKQIVASYAVLLDVYPEMGRYVAKDLAAWERTDLSERIVARAATSAGIEVGDGSAPGDGASGPREIRWSELRTQGAERGHEERVKLPGYVLPLESSGEQVTLFLLVPYVGACIHTPSPPADQIVRVSAPQGIRDPGLFAPIWVTGRLQRKETRNTLFLVDGSAEITSGYALNTSRIDEYSAASSDALAQVEVPALMADHSWWQNVHTRVSILFTGTMADIRHQGSVVPLLFGLFLAFTYGAVHTLGPGHGKAVVVSYFVGEGGSLLRGIRFGTQIAVFHVLAAILVAVLADVAIRQATGNSPGAFKNVRLASYAAIALIGGAMVAGTIRSARRNRNGRGHEHHCGCHPTGKQENASGFGLLSLAIGAVPCTGALMVLLYGLANDLLWPSVLMVAAISVGMAVAMSAIGIAAILGRRFVESRLKQDASLEWRLLTALRIAGATCVLLIGLALFSLTLLSGTPASLPLVAR
jgi:ABC-type nickel/cobalt efflux system permease component RcnA